MMRMSFLSCVSSLRAAGGLVESRPTSTAQCRPMELCTTPAGRPSTGPTSKHWLDWRGRLTRAWTSTSTPSSTCVEQSANCPNGWKKVLHTTESASILRGRGNRKSLLELLASTLTANTTNPRILCWCLVH